VRINTIALGVVLGIVALTVGCGQRDSQSPESSTATPAAAPASTADPTSNPESLGMSSAALETLGANMRDIVDRGERTAIVTLVSRRGKIVHLQAYGLADREANRPVTVNTLFRMCSMTHSQRQRAS
jgi:CubicO group peptidase (beta-lactamase class C family)